MKNLVVPTSIVIAGLIIVGAVVYKKSPSTVSGLDHIRGNLKAEVSIVEFSDFQCSFCQIFHPTVQQILANFPDKVRWVYKHFPLDQIHPLARPAAEASECAAEQEKFWEFSDLLFENQERLGEALYKELSAQIGLNLDQFNSCFSSRKYKDKVESDYQEGIKAGVRGTPASFVNGELVSGAVPYETLKSVIEKALTSKNTSALREFIVEGNEYSFSPASISVSAGELVRVTLKNIGHTGHNFVIQDLGVSTRTISPGQTDTVEFTVSASGTYTFFCSVPGHRSAGMAGSLKVE